MISRSGVIYVYSPKPQNTRITPSAPAQNQVQIKQFSTPKTVQEPVQQVSRPTFVPFKPKITPAVVNPQPTTHNQKPTTYNPQLTTKLRSSMAPRRPQMMPKPVVSKPPAPEVPFAFADQVVPDVTKMLAEVLNSQDSGIVEVSSPKVQPQKTRDFAPDLTIPKSDQTVSEKEDFVPEIVKTESLTVDSTNSVKIPDQVRDDNPTTHNPQLTTTVPMVHADDQGEPLTSHPSAHTSKLSSLNSQLLRRSIGTALLIAAIAGIALPFLPQARLETSYASQQIERKVDMMVRPTVALPPAVPFTFTPLIGPDGKEIVPINTEFSVIVPKIGINAAIVASVDPLNAKEYTEALKKGVAHAKTSYFPDQDGAVYLFSHSTNYQWFVKDLNAIFYNVKNLADGDFIIVYYKGKRYTYQYKSREIVAAKNTSYLLPVTGKRQLILQTCWPPGTTTSRLLIFADLVEEKGVEI